MSATQTESRRIPSNTVHKLDENTDFYNLWYPTRTGYLRVYRCNNLVSIYKKGQYKNSSFKTHGKPIIKKILWLPFLKKVIKWTLPYKSTIVFPIRYVFDFTLSEDDRNIATNTKHWVYWGFLCIDCKSRNVFDPIYTPELGAAFADLLYTLFFQLDKEN